MQISIPAKHGNTSAQIDRFPDSCPICNHGIVPIDTGVKFLADARIEMVFRCPRDACASHFVSRYTQNSFSGIYNFTASLPAEMRKVKFGPTISGISKDFVEIFQQADVAEKEGLSLVCGPGYRKALEFLIKDYVIRLHPTEAEAIKKLPLAACIAKYVENGRIVNVASRAAWLGNDETHYERKWVGKDLQDLKDLISLTVHWIEMEELTKAITKDMPDPKKETPVGA